MRTPRVFLKTELKANSIIELDQNISDHLKVTNKKIGQQLHLFDVRSNAAKIRHELSELRKRKHKEDRELA